MEVREGLDRPAYDDKPLDGTLALAALEIALLRMRLFLDSYAHAEGAKIKDLTTEKAKSLRDKYDGTFAVLESWANLCRDSRIVKLIERARPEWHIVLR